MGLLNIIRRMHLRQKLSIREIARLTGVSRNTVTKHLAANTIEPKFATPERPSKCRVVLKSETARAGGYSLPLNVRFCFRKQRASQVLFHYLINCGK